MTTFDDRQQAFENKFKHDQDLQFRVHARRAKLLGLWAAAQMKMTADEAETYAKQVVSADFEEAGSADIIRKVHADLAEKGIALSTHQVEREAERLLGEAKVQIMSA